jgi:superfamily I DNA/RNA helicase
MHHVCFVLNFVARFADPGDEADVIAQRASAALSAGCTVAVITRTNRQLLQMQSSMMVAGVPYRKMGNRQSGRSFRAAQLRRGGVAEGKSS